MVNASFSELAARYKLRDTLPRRFIYSQLENGITHFASLLLNCSPVGIDTSTVYRNIGLFRKVGLVTETGAGRNRYVQLSSDIHNHFHHLRCEGCGRTVSFDDDILEGLLITIARKNGFLLVSSHTLEMLGCCLDCKSTSSQL
jgi:Fur family ferric uptake transcriptional regulator